MPRLGEKNRLDPKIGDDVSCVLSAAAVLDITEFDLFRLAYVRWHGESARDALLERFYVSYMFRSVVPIWVRDFSRLVLRLQRQGMLDPASLGVKQLTSSRKMVSRGLRFGVALTLIFVCLVVFVQFTARFLDLGGRCLFPPCY